MATIPIGDQLFTAKHVSHGIEKLNLRHAKKAVDHEKKEDELFYKSQRHTSTIEHVHGVGIDPLQERQMQKMGLVSMPHCMELIPIQENQKRFLGLGFSVGMNATPVVMNTNFILYNVPQ